ncbi:MAG: DUF167 domain-containing protein [Candidatus Omnitrophota bacterium]
MKRNITLKVITRANKDELIGLSKDSYKIKITAMPEKGKANKRIIALLSEKFNVKKADIRILSGLKSANKIVEIGS